MARSINEIYDQMVLEKQNMSTLSGLQPNIDNSQTLLADLTSTSKVAVWRLIFFVVAVAIWVHEVLFDKHAAEIEARANELISGTKEWLRDQCFIFQYGDELEWDGKKYVYVLLDENKRIIKRSAVIEVNGQVRVKVAKLDGSGLPEPLTTSELTAFSAYINKVKFAGTNVAIISYSADLLKIHYEITYDPLVMNDSGALISDPSVKPVEVAINGLIQNLPFNGVLNLTKLTDAIQNATGVIDPILISAEARYGSTPFVPIVKSYEANAGHMQIDPAYPLSTTINYMANV